MAPSVNLAGALPREHIVFADPKPQEFTKGSDKPKRKGKKAKKAKKILYSTSLVELKRPEDIEPRGMTITLPQCTIRGGVIYKDDEDDSGSSDDDDETKPPKRVKVQIMCVFDSPLSEYMTDEDYEELKSGTDKWVDDMAWIREKALEYRWEHREKIGVDTEIVTSKDIMRPQIAKVIYKRATDTYPAMWINLRCFSDNRTPFFDLEQKPVDWALLKGATFKGVPTIKIRHIFSNSQHTSFIMDVMSVQMTSAIEETMVYNPSAGLAERIRNQTDLAERQRETLAIRANKRLCIAEKPHEEAEESDDDLTKIMG